MLTNPETYSFAHTMRQEIADQKNAEVDQVPRYHLGRSIVMANQIMDDWKDLVIGSIENEIRKNLP